MDTQHHYDRPYPPVRRRARLAQQPDDPQYDEGAEQEEPHQSEFSEHVQEQVMRVIGEPEHTRLRHLRVENEMVPSELTEADAEKRKVEKHQKSGLPDLYPLLSTNLGRAETRRSCSQIGIQPGQKDARWECQ
jgi:hypothetical protein